jgi:hypothetical protein
MIQCSLSLVRAMTASAVIHPTAHAVPKHDCFVTVAGFDGVIVQGHGLIVPGPLFID